MNEIFIKALEDAKGQFLEMEHALLLTKDEMKELQEKYDSLSASYHRVVNEFTTTLKAHGIEPKTIMEASNG